MKRRKRNGTNCCVTAPLRSIGEAAKKLRREVLRQNQKTRPFRPLKTKLKCGWCIKGFRDPDLFEIERQSLTLSMDALVVCLQLISSFRWKLIIADVEGAFLQGEPINRKNGKIFVKIPKEGVPGLNRDDVVEVTKCVYGLADAPRAWWLSFSKAGLMFFGYSSI